MFFKNNWQKSPKRRFLFILGAAAFIAICTFGLMVLFWDKMLPNIPKSQKTVFGGIIILYAFIRFSRLLKRAPDEED
jgi:CHASE2 domain-containing sensor protein